MRRNAGRRIAGAVRRQYDRQPRAGEARQLAVEQRAAGAVEAVVRLVQQQQPRPPGERARQQYAAALAVGQRQEAPAPERRERQAREHLADAATLGRTEPRHRPVGAARAAGNDALDAEVPVVAMVLVLALAADVGDARQQLGERDRPAARVPVVAPLAPIRRRPALAREQLHELGLAGAVGAEQQARRARGRGRARAARRGRRARASPPRAARRRRSRRAPVGPGAPRPAVALELEQVRLERVARIAVVQLRVDVGVHDRQQRVERRLPKGGERRHDPRLARQPVRGARR